MRTASLALPAVTDPTRDSLLADLGLLFQPQSHISQIGPSISVPIFEGGRNTANLQAARASYREGRGELRRARG